jgi:hypothetical protein
MESSCPQCRAPMGASAIAKGTMNPRMRILLKKTYVLSVALSVLIWLGVAIYLLRTDGMENVYKLVFLGLLFVFFLISNLFGYFVMRRKW